MKYSKPKRLSTHLKVAKLFAAESHAKRLKVGAVLIKNDRVISTGYNGMPAGMDNDCEVKSSVDPNAPLATRPEVTHAEMNVIGEAAAMGRATEGCIMVTTHSPCFECAKLIKSSRISAVYYETEYRITDSLKFLKKVGIKVEKL